MQTRRHFLYSGGDDELTARNARDEHLVVAIAVQGDALQFHGSRRLCVVTVHDPDRRLAVVLRNRTRRDHRG